MADSTPAPLVRWPRLNRATLLWLVCQTFLVTSTARPASNPAPPVAARIPHATELHGDRREDPYFWLREKTNPAVVAYLKAENAYTRRVMKPTAALQRRLFQEMRSHLKETDLSVPYFHDGFFYYTRTEKGRQYPIHCRRRGTMEAPEEVILDLNRLARGRPFFAVGEIAVSDDGNLLAYTTDITGFRDYTLEVKDLRTGRLMPLKASHVDGVAWAADNRTLWYTVEDDAKRPYRLCRARADKAAGAAVVFTEPDERFTVDVDRSRSREWLFLHIESHTTSEVRILRADDPEGTWRVVAPREQDHEYSLDHHGDWFYIRSNQSGRDFALFRAPVADPARARWEPVVPHRPGVLIEGMDFFEHFYVLSELENALPHLRFTDLQTGETHRVPFDEAAYFVQLHANPEFRTDRIRYVYQSFTRPSAVLEYDWRTRRSTLLKQTEVPGGFDPGAYESERVEATAPDGRRIPISLVHRKGTPVDGRAPMLLTGYGAYGIPSMAYFSVARLSLLDRGVVYAVAHIRGGGDLGKRWHDDGRMRNKRNTFTDFIACAEHLVNTRRTSSERLAIQGGSAGGLLIGAVLNLRPDLFRAAILDVPFVDVLNTMLDETLPLTVGEFEEWGNPKDAGDYAYMRTYCPYTNLAARRYPAMLVNTSLNDSQVMYWEPAKYTARLRTLKQDANPLLLRVNMAAGHGGASGRYDALKELAFDYAFLLHQWGLDR